VSLEQQIKDQVNERIERNLNRHRDGGGLLTGLILIVVGTLFLLAHMGYLQAEQVWKFWPLLIVIVGIAKLMSPEGRVLGVLAIAIGGFLQLNKLGFTALTLRDVWPVILIALGVMMIFSRTQLRQWTSLPKTPDGGDSAQTMHEFAVFGSVERRITVSNFRGGTISAIFGSVEVDFRSADIDGEEAVLIVEAMFGGIEITVPERWTVVYQGQSIFGGYSDETRPPIPDPTGTPTKKKLILRGRAVFGGIVVKN